MIVGVLGGIGSGKSTVTSMLVDLGALAIDADGIAHEVIQLDVVRTRIHDWLGDDVITAEGLVDRQAVARRVFGSEEDLETLQRMVHPEVRRRILEQIEAFRGTLRTSNPQERPTTGMLVLDIPLLLDSPFEALCDVLVYVDAPAEQRLARVSERGWKREELETRERRQHTLDDKRSRAARIIDNSASLEDTRRAVERLYADLVKVTESAESDLSGDRKNSDRENDDEGNGESGSRGGGGLPPLAAAANTEMR